MNNKDFKNYFQRFISLTFFFIIIISCIVTYFTVKKFAYPIFLKKEQENIKNIGNSILLELRKKIKNAETLSLSIAGIYETLEKKNSVFMRIIPQLLNLTGYENIVAGGGVWPEPYMFNKNILYRSFFWGRDKKGVLKYYDDYNKPSYKGYFGEEWYVPTKYLYNSKVYWSRAYTDPYSKQPMVTCSSPIKQNGKFIGVATVDLKIEGLEKLFSHYAKEIKGYIFVLDRENNFLYFPKEIIEDKKYVNLTDFIKRFPQFSSVKNNIDLIDKKLISLAKRKNKNFDKIVNKISKESYQITKKEAILITAILSLPLKGKIPNNWKPFKIKKDIIFNEATNCSVFYMSGTYWKIGVVVPERLILGLVNQISEKIIFYLLFFLICILLAGYFLIKHRLLIPLKKITTQLANFQNKNNFFIDYSSNDELGKLVFYLNKSTKELRESESYAKAIFEQSPVSIQIFDKNGIAIDSNKAWEQLWLVNKEDFNGKYNILKDKILKNSKEFKYIQDVFNGKAAVIGNFEYKLKSIANIGRDRILNVIMFPIKDNNSKIVRVVVMQEDITDKIKMEETIQRVGQLEALGELSAGIAHDFNNILTGMLLNLEMLEIKLKEKDEKDKATKFINKIKISIDSAKELINKIKMLSRKEEHKMSPCKLNEVLQESLDIIKPAIPMDINLNIDITKEECWINGDKNTLNQLIINILINARDAIKSAKKHESIIKVKLKKENNIAILTISDNGVGIPENIKDRIFEPFFTTKQKTEHRGTGLGLSIVHNVVMIHKGEIILDSVVGEGTIFTIKFPLIDSFAEKLEKNSEPIGLKKELYNKTILLVEDEKSIRDAESEILEYLGFKVLKSENGKEAINIIKSGVKIDIILIDWYMPIMDGEKTISAIREFYKTIPIFVVSGAISETIEKFKKDKLIIEIINKPFTKKEIIEKLNLIQFST